MSLHVNFDLAVDESQDRVSFDSLQQCALTEANHISITGEVTVNGKRCRHHTHLFRNAEGNWITQSEFTGENNHKRYYDVSLMGMDVMDNNPSFAAKERAYNNIPIMLSKALNALPDLDEKRRDAESSDAGHQRESMVGKRAELLLEVAKLERKIAAEGDRLKAAHDRNLPEAFSFDDDDE